MIFTDVCAGWERVAHDAHVLTEIAANPNNGFSFRPPSKLDKFNYKNDN